MKAEHSLPQERRKLINTIWGESVGGALEQANPLSPLMAILEDPLGVEVHLGKGIMCVWWTLSINNRKEIAGNSVLKPLSGTVSCTTQKGTAYKGEGRKGC